MPSQCASLASTSPVVKGRFCSAVCSSPPIESGVSRGQFHFPVTEGSRPWSESEPLAIRSKILHRRRNSTSTSPQVETRKEIES